MLNIETLENMIPITKLSKGGAAKVLDEVKKTGPKVIIKNNKPEGIIMSVDAYEELLDRLDDYELHLQAARRMNQTGQNADKKTEEMKRFGISPEDLKGITEE